MWHLKLIIFALFLNSIHLSSHAQTYPPLLEENKTWDVFYWGNPMFDPSCPFIFYCSGQQFYINGDTIINDLHYKIIRTNYIGSVNESGFFLWPFQLYESTTISGFMREDTVTKQIYSIYPSYYGDEEYLAYDFNMEVGDTLVVSYMDNALAILTAIVDYDGVRKQFFFDILYGWGEGEYYYIEGFGGDSGLFFPFEYSADLVCVKENGDVVLDNNCQGIWPTSIEEQGAVPSKLQIYPNPVTTQATVQIPNFPSTQKPSLYLYDLLGKKISTHSLDFGQQHLTIDTQNWQSGIYFAVLEIDGKVVTKEKMVVIK